MSVSEQASPSPRALAEKKRPLVQRAKEGIVYYVLGVQDTPHRIALGVFLGFMIGMTPTIGVQLVIYVAFAALLRANKISGILPVFISNPVTAVPLYYFNWWVGNLATGGDTETADFARRAIDRVTSWEGSWWSLVRKVFEPGTWTQIWRLVVELWVGSLIVGGVLGILFYFVTLEAVHLYRKKTGPA